MPETATLGPKPAEYDAAWVRAKYDLERDKRLRTDAVEQYVEVTADFSHYADDPWTQRVQRASVHDHVQVAIIGAGLGSLIAAARLQEEHAGAGITHRADGERIHLVEVEVHTHGSQPQDGRSSASEPPVELTVSTTGAPMP